jgi:hypothetical protein
MRFHKSLFESQDDRAFLGIIALTFLPPLLMDLIARYFAG